MLAQEKNTQYNFKKKKKKNVSKKIFLLWKEHL